MSLINVPGLASASDRPLTPAQARLEAATTGHPVEIESDRTPYSTVFANPDGTATMNSSAVPVRVRSGGEWVDIDTTLVAHPDGSIAPRATLLPERVGAGGDTLIFSIGAPNGRGTVSVHWPTALPHPELRNNTATYTEVLPGVDLVVTAKGDSITDTLVVKTREAAAHPQVRKLALSMRATGLTAGLEPGGRIALRDELGHEWLNVAPPVMWDSSAGSAESRAVSEPEIGDRILAPLEGDHVRSVSMSLSGTTLNLSPSTSLLDAPTTRYPVFIDPIIGPSNNARLMVDKTYPTNSYYNWGGDQGVGYQNYSGVSTKRLYWQFPSTSGSSTWRNTKIVSATFGAVNTHSAYCTGRPVSLWRTSGFTSSTNWNTRPTNYGSALATNTFAYGTNCGDGSTPKVNFNAAVGVQTVADANGTAIVLSLQTSETDPLNWKRFRYDATLSVTYDVKPTISGNRLNTPSKTCVTGSTRPVISASSVKFQATSADSSDDLVAIRWYYKRSTTTTWSNTLVSGTAPGTRSSAAVAVTDGTYSFYAVASDSYTTSAPSATCEFTVDTTAPPAPSVSSAQYPSDGSSHGGIGVSGSFSVSAVGATSFTYGFDVDAPTTTVPATTGSATVTFTPQSFGPHFLKVVAKDVAGNTSSEALYTFNVYGTAADYRHRYLLDAVDGAGPFTSPDAVASGAVTVSGPTAPGLVEGKTWTTEDTTDHGVSFLDGGSLTAAPASPVLNVNDNFTVCANVTVPAGAGDGTYVVASQNTSVTYAWRLSYVVSSGAGRFQFDLNPTNSATGTAVNVDSSYLGPPANGWESVCVRYDDGDGPTLTMYSAGMQVAEKALAARVNYTAAGEFRLGAGAGGSQPFSGYLDDLRLLQGAVSDTEMAQLSA